MVEVVHGPLSGVIGRLVRKDAQRARLVLSVDLIGQGVSVEVDAADVKPYLSIHRAERAATESRPDGFCVRLRPAFKFSSHENRIN